MKKLIDYKIEYLLVAGILLGLLGSLFLLNRKQLSKDVSALTSVSPDGFTELYFLNPNSLPQTFTASESGVISFAIHNKEGSEKRYQYRVLVSEGSSTSVLSTEMADLENDEVKYLREVIHVPNTKTTKRAKITIQLMPTQQEISLWLEKVASTSAITLNTL